MELNRRQFLGAAGVVTAPLVLAGCGFSKSDSESDSSGSQTLTFTTWGTDSELAGFRKAIAGFEKANSGVKVKLNAVPYEQIFTNIDAQLQAGNPPDVFRVQYYNLGAYAGRGQLLDLGKYVDDGFGDRFTPQAWAAVQNKGKAYGVPHHTDTSVIYYNKPLLTAAGITSVPTKLEQAWTWDELDAIGQKLRGSLPGDKYPFVYNWQGSGVTRWFSLLFQAGGKFLDSDQATPAIDSEQGRAALDFSKGFFTKSFVPPNSSVKSTTYAQDIWYAGTAAMSWGGAFQLPDATANLKFDWGVTFAPRKARAGSDFGGNALVATAATKKGKLAASFLEYMTGTGAMQAFCAQASLLPTRRDLASKPIQFAARPELSPIFVGQASTVKPADAAQVASPSMAKIITVFKDQLEEAFVGGQSTDDTVKKLTDGISTATGK